MAPTKCDTAMSLIFDLKHSINIICRHYRSAEELGRLTYEEGVPGAMQRAELMEIMETMAGRKNKW